MWEYHQTSEPQGTWKAFLESPVLDVRKKRIITCFIGVTSLQYVLRLCRKEYNTETGTEDIHTVVA